MTDKMQVRPRRRPRLSDAETEERMLNAGLSFVAEQGLSLSLEHVQMEELIQAAGVSRTSSYRRWPTKSLFAADLLIRIAQATDLSGDVPGLPEALESIPSTLLARLGTPQGRRDATVEVLRIVMGTDFTAMLASTEWRAYIALRAAYIGVLDGELRTRVARALSETERRFTKRRSQTFHALAKLLGYRLRDPATTTWEQISLTLNAVATGMLIHAYSDPAAVTDTTERTAFGSTYPAKWSPATHAEAGVILSEWEPDPDIEWSPERITTLRARLTDATSTLNSILATRDA
ncbi:hypothetical protein [Bifidobacterium mongoliense]|uniref:hypothetical protein n=1 Tax=Bifidobacterium mongoliense TaxID=518643 RepID=UPI002647EB42|nr:hypothetical protein [Bifidobacterium mongoliense]MDN6024977.1 hypothetical protein [Bifidobacterium mongoliense]MDN6719943.1 hypothetical protein [Bifidobacterium mongoliense]